MAFNLNAAWMMGREADWGWDPLTTEIEGWEIISVLDETSTGVCGQMVLSVVVTQQQVVFDQRLLRFLSLLLVLRGFSLSHQYCFCL